MGSESEFEMWMLQRRYAAATISIYVGYVQRAEYATGDLEHATGAVWQWTSSPFVGYPGFEPFPYREYSEVFFGPEYKVLRGGSWATHRSAIRTTFRNWDYPIRRQIFAGFRTARDA